MVHDVSVPLAHATCQPLVWAVCVLLFMLRACLAYPFAKLPNDLLVRLLFSHAVGGDWCMTARNCMVDQLHVA